MDNNDTRNELLNQVLALRQQVSELKAEFQKLQSICEENSEISDSEELFEEETEDGIYDDDDDEY